MSNDLLAGEHLALPLFQSGAMTCASITPVLPEMYIALAKLRTWLGLTITIANPDSVSSLAAKKLVATNRFKNCEFLLYSAQLQCQRIDSLLIIGMGRIAATLASTRFLKTSYASVCYTTVNCQIDSPTLLALLL